MSSRLKIRVFTLALVIAVSGSAVFAAPKQSRNDDLFSRIERIVKFIGKKLIPTILDDPTFPKP